MHTGSPLDSSIFTFCCFPTSSASNSNTPAHTKKIHFYCTHNKHEETFFGLVNKHPHLPLSKGFYTKESGENSKRINKSSNPLDTINQERTNNSVHAYSINSKVHTASIVKESA
jgi:hypothetical protein